MIWKNMKRGVEMKSYTVYRVNYRTNTTDPIGCVVDRRKRERHNNPADMLRLAQKLYGTSSIDAHIFILREDSLPNLSLVEA